MGGEFRAEFRRSGDTVKERDYPANLGHRRLSSNRASVS
jgi:hypothetical protein